jgi:hypothetical protein
MVSWEVRGQIFSEDQEPVCLSAVEDGDTLEVFHSTSEDDQLLVTSLPLCIVLRQRVTVRVNPGVEDMERIVDAECWLDADALATIRVEACDAEQHGWFWLRAFRR